MHVGDDDERAGRERRAHARRRRACETAGLVAMIHSALMRPSATARNRSTAFRPGCVGDARRVPEALHAVAMRPAFSKSMCAASWLARPPTSRPPMALGWPVIENGPVPGLPMRPVARWQLMIALTLSVPRGRLVDALAEDGDGALGVAANSS